MCVMSLSCCGAMSCCCVMVVVVVKVWFDVVCSCGCQVMVSVVI